MMMMPYGAKRNNYGLQPFVYAAVPINKGLVFVNSALKCEESVDRPLVLSEVAKVKQYSADKLK